MRQRIMAVDLGFAACGVVVLDGDLELLENRLVATKRETKRLMLHQSSDDARRIDVLVDELRGVVRRHAPDVIAYELPSGSRGATQARALGYAHGMIRAVGHGLTMIEITVLDSRRAVVGARAGRVPEEVAHAVVIERWPQLALASVHERDAAVIGLSATMIRR